MYLNLLFLDDDDIQNDIMEEYVSLCDTPKKSNFFTDCFEALEYIKEQEKDSLPNVLFVDVSMPLLNGWEVLERVEKIMENKDWEPSIYVLTSSVTNKDRAKAARQKHLKSFLNKPMKIDKLKTILQDEYSQLATSK